MVEDSIGTIVEWAFEDGPNLQQAPAGFAPVIMATDMIVSGGEDAESIEIEWHRVNDYYRLK